MERRRYPEGQEWRAGAACRGKDSDIFFPITENEEPIAKAICRTCPVSAECLEFALTSNQDSGIWGGFNEKERRNIRRKRGLRKKPNQNSPTRY